MISKKQTGVHFNDFFIASLTFPSNLAINYIYFGKHSLCSGYKYGAQEV